MHNVFAISSVHHFAPFVEVEYFNDRNAFTAVLAIFSLRIRKIGIIYTSCPKSVVAIVLGGKCGNCGNLTTF